MPVLHWTEDGEMDWWQKDDRSTVTKIVTFFEYFVIPTSLPTWSTGSFRQEQCHHVFVRTKQTDQNIDDLSVQLDIRSIIYQKKKKRETVLLPQENFKCSYLPTSCMFCCATASPSFKGTSLYNSSSLRAPPDALTRPCEWRIFIN